MASWSELATDAPDFAERVRARFDSGTNKTLATLRRDGSPRISGSELRIADGEVTLGMMAASVKLADVRRTPGGAALADPGAAAGRPGRLAGGGEARRPAGRWLPPAARRAARTPRAFRLDIAEAVLTYVTSSPPDGPVDLLVVESWHPGVGHRRRTRA